MMLELETDSIENLNLLLQWANDNGMKLQPAKRSNWMMPGPPISSEEIEAYIIEGRKGPFFSFEEVFGEENE